MPKEIQVLEMDREMRLDVRRTGKRPRDAYMETLVSIPKKLKTSTEQEAVVGKFPSFNEIRRPLNRHRIADHMPVPDPLNIPDELRVTLRGRQLAVDDANYGERFLLHRSIDGKLLVFCADTELKVLHDSEYLVCNGTFEMAPTSTFQLYTVHGYLNGEGMALFWALLPNKTQGTYVEMWTAVRDALVSKFGDTGNIWCFLTDFELAAIHAIQEVFPQTNVKGCTFHFRQAIMRHVGNEGLQTVYNSRNPSSIREWIRQLMAMSMLPAFVVPYAWEFLKVPPPTADPHLDVKLQSFANYFERTWISGSFPHHLWTHFDHEGPRTTNQAEGWHNALNHRFGIPHPSLTNFLNWLRKRQYDVQCRGIQLTAGRPAKPRSAVYVRLESDLQRAKVQLTLKMGNICVNIFPQNAGWQMMESELRLYLKHVCYLLVGSD
jgi:hypothetical protein